MELVQAVTERSTGEQGAVEGRATISGGFGGSVIWSMGWNAWGSGAIRTVVDADFAFASDEESGVIRVRFDVVNRFGIRP